MTNPYHLTKRELEIAELLMQGKSNKQIAQVLGISEHTVEFHLKNIYEKLQVSSRGEAGAKLWESLGRPLGVKPGESRVEAGMESAHNRNGSILGLSETSPTAEKKGQDGTGNFFAKHKTAVVAIVIVLAAGLIFMLSRSAAVGKLAMPTPTEKPSISSAWEKYERECEYPDESTVGQTLDRENAVGKKVHGQFGSAGEAPWPAKAGYVIYKNISIPQLDALYLKLRYSKGSPATVPILIYLDDETGPRASIFPVDQQSWDQFTWTDPVYLGGIESGVHSLKFSTTGQQYGVADLDQLILTR